MTGDVSTLQSLQGVRLRRLRVLVEDDDAILAQSRGEVRGTSGLGSEQIFGADPFGRAVRFGHLALPYPMTHPITRKEPRLTVVPVLPPSARALRDFSAAPMQPTGTNDEPLYEWLASQLESYRESRPGGLLEGLFQESGADLDQELAEHYATLAARLGGIEAARDFIERFDAAVEKGAASVAEPGVFRTGLDLLRGLGLNVASLEEPEPEFVEAELYFLPQTLTANELIVLLNPNAARHRLQLTAEEKAVTATTFGLSIRIRLLTEKADLKKWNQREPAKSTGKAMALQVDYALREQYRGEHWEYANGGRVLYRIPIHVVALGKALEQIAGAQYVNLYRWPRFR